MILVKVHDGNGGFATIASVNTNSIKEAMTKSFPASFYAIDNHPQKDCFMVSKASDSSDRAFVECVRMPDIKPSKIVEG